MTKRTLTREAILELGYSTGGFPIGKGQLIQIFEQSGAYESFDELKEKMRSALMRVHPDWSMELIADSAHICAVVAYKIQEAQP